MLTRAEEKRIRHLVSGRRRPGDDLFLAEGIRVVEELLDAGLTPRLVVASPSLEDTPRGARLARRLADAGTVRHVGDGELRDLAGTQSPQGVLVVAATPAGDLDAIARAAPGRAVVLVLDAVQDPGNLGTLVRSAAAFGCAGLVCLPGTVDPWSPKAVRASAGTLFRLPVARPAWPELEGWLGREGFTLVGAEADGTAPRELAIPDRVALAVGNEGAGLTPALRERCVAVVAVPMRGGAESLNVAVAAAILLYEFTRESQ